MSIVVHNKKMIGIFGEDEEVGKGVKTIF